MNVTDWMSTVSTFPRSTMLYLVWILKSSIDPVNALDDFGSCDVADVVAGVVAVVVVLVVSFGLTFYSLFLCAVLNELLHDASFHRNGQIFGRKCRS